MFFLCVRRAFAAFFDLRTNRSGDSGAEAAEVRGGMEGSEPPASTLQPALLSVEGRTHHVSMHYRETAAADFVRAAVDTALDIHRTQDAGDILIFLPGQDHIDTAIEQLMDASRDSSRRHEMRLVPMALYSALPPADQLRVFEPLPKGHRKVLQSSSNVDLPFPSCSQTRTVILQSPSNMEPTSFFAAGERIGDVWLSTTFSRVAHPIPDRRWWWRRTSRRRPSRWKGWCTWWTRASPRRRASTRTRACRRSWWRRRPRPTPSSERGAPAASGRATATASAPCVRAALHHVSNQRAGIGPRLRSAEVRVRGLALTHTLSEAAAPPVRRHHAVPQGSSAY